MGVFYGGRRAGYYDQFSADTGGEGPHVDTERTVITNGRFLHNLDGWSAAGGAAYSAGDGDDHYGVAVLPTGGGSISQVFAVEEYRAFTLHLSMKADGASAAPGSVTAQIADGAGNTVGTWNLSGAADTWTAQTIQIGLAQGTTYTLTLANVSHAGAVALDDIWLWWLPMTRSQIAARVARTLGALATDAGRATTPAGELTEGDYTDAVDAGLRAIGAINPITDQVDIRQLETRQINDVLTAVEHAMLAQLQRHYATLVDTKEGPLEQKLSQIATAIARTR